MNPRLAIARAIALASLILTPGFGYAQQQPPQAVNQQDEVVNFLLRPGETPEEALGILRSDDKFETNEYVTQAFELFHSEAYEMLLVIREAVSAEKGFVRGAKTYPPDGEAPRYFLVVTTTPEQMPSIAESIKQLDIPNFVNSQGRTRTAIRLKYRLASELGRVLQNTRLTPLAKVFADDLTNTLYFDESAYVTEQVQDYIKFYDVPTPQIEFDVRVIEVSEGDAGKVGLDWDAWKRSLGGQFVFTGSTFEGGENWGRLDSLLALDASTLADFLNYTVQRGHARIVKRSRINASNLNPAVISETKRVPFYDYTRNERIPAVISEENPRVTSAGELDSDDPDATTERTVTVLAPAYFTRRDLGQDEEGIFIQIQPVIGTEMVSAQIEIEVNTLSGYDAQDRPIVTEQSLNNQFTLEDKQTILLGTIERQNATEARRGIPGLREIPYIRALASVKSFREEQTRIFVLATPTYSNFAYDAKNLKEVKTIPPLKELHPGSQPEDAELGNAFGEEPRVGKN